MRLLSLASAAAAVLGSLASLAQAAPLPAALAGATGKPYQLTFLQTLLTPSLVGQDTITALGAANLTVFAPTDAAFMALLAQLNITDPTSPALLAIAPQILSYHVSTTVVSSAYLAANKTSFVPTLLGNSSLAAINHQVVEVVAAGSNVTLRSAYGLGSKVIDTIVADNGVIHVIDSVLIPPTNLTNTLTTLTASKAIGSTFSQIASLFVTAAAAAPEAAAIDTVAPITIFVPSDAGVTKQATALAALATGNLTQAIASILTYHIITPAGPYYIPPTGTVKTVGGEDLNIVTDATTGKVTVNGNDVIATILLTNGVAHVIDTILVPPSIAKLLGGNATVSASASASASKTTAAAAATASATGAAKPGSAARVAGSAAGLLAALAMGVVLA
ncbi:hypothetical protein M427DRAFT_144087 [Gonapodya prolifera JEL478]|uniref:FAS1 domain-containing protein n=1 Tax=Gonapodya prolifera (strain JEL478) TaxID=1344416 RepID=A0A139AML5_GONPJ|nr:hypothetical protein M427DRAFT_144087 [Gonapodya prolifera JEL478]|eukprot:KXS18012.1 hypothetical protein M427DRAFT_144087 [Gonapodya prolifera JEL478]